MSYSRPSGRGWRGPATAVAAATGLVLAGWAIPATAQLTSPATPYLAEAHDPAVTTLADERGISVAEAQRRIGWQQPAIEMAAELQNSLGERFGGLWFDPANGRVQVGIVSSAWSAASPTMQLSVSRWQLDAVTDPISVPVSYPQLKRDLAWLNETVSDANQGVSPEARLVPAIKVSQNQLVLMVPEATALSKAQRDAIAAATERLDSRLNVQRWDGRIVPAACGTFSGNFACDAPLRGGVATYRAEFTGGDPPFRYIHVCTAAFPARSRSNGKWYILTAGHCEPKGITMWAYQPRTGNQHVIGEVHKTNANQEDKDLEGNDDYAIVKIDNVSGWDPRPWVYVHGNDPTTTTDPDYRIRGTSTSPEGTRVCFSGASVDTDCGDIIANDVFGDTGLAWVDNPFCPVLGDSGSPVYSDHLARGIVTARVVDNGVCGGLYQGVREAARESNVYVVTTNNP